jgi:hypothetical protein
MVMVMLFGIGGRYGVAKECIEEMQGLTRYNQRKMGAGK